MGRKGGEHEEAIKREETVERETEVREVVKD